MIFKHPQRKSVLHESREPYPCHTFRNDAAVFFAPSCNVEATHAQRCNSCRSGACPNVQIHYPCRLRRRQEPSKNLAIITIRPRIGLVRLANYCPCQPHAAETAQDREKTTKSRQTPPPLPPDPPRWSRPPPAPALRHCKTYYKSSILPFYTEGRGPEAWGNLYQPLP